jgi:hypothetical protein
MKASIFIPSSALIENADQDFNELSNGYQRARSPYWRMMGGLLGLPPKRTRRLMTRTVCLGYCGYPALRGTTTTADATADYRGRRC